MAAAAALTDPHAHSSPLGKHIAAMKAKKAEADAAAVASLT
jgi:hypothetical protein